MTTNINHGFDNISEYQGLTVPDFKKDFYNPGWRYEANSLSDFSEIYLYQATGSVFIKAKHLKNLFIKLKLNSNTYNDIPSIRIRTLPKADGSDVDPLYHDSFTVKVANNNLYEQDSILYFHYEGFPSDLQTEQNFAMSIISSEGTHDSNLGIKDILLFTDPSATTDYNILQCNYRNSQNQHFNYNINFGTVNEGTNQLKINETLDSIKLNSDSMLTLTTANNKILEEQNKDGFGQIILGSAGCTAILADSSIIPTADSENREGLKFFNSTAGTKYNLYFFGGLQETVLQSNLGSLYCKLFIDIKTATNCIPFLHVYTKPKLDGSDAQPWYNSKWTYTMDSSQHVGIGEEVVLYAINEPNKKFTNRLIELENIAVDGNGSDGEVLYLVLGSDSGASVNTISHTINLLGFNTTNSLQRNFNLLSHLVNEPISRHYQVNVVNNSTILANGDIGDVIDMNLNKTINIYGSGTGNHNFYIFQSGDNVNFFLSEEVNAVATNSNYHFYTSVSNCLRYVKLVNNNHTNTYTLNYSLL